MENIKRTLTAELQGNNSVAKWVKDMNSFGTKERWEEGKHVRKCSSPLVSSEGEATMMSCPYTPIRMVRIKLTVLARLRSNTAGGNTQWGSHFGKQSGTFSQSCCSTLQSISRAPRYLLNWSENTFIQNPACEYLWLLYSWSPKLEATKILLNRWMDKLYNILITKYCSVIKTVLSASMSSAWVQALAPLPIPAFC